MPNNAMMKICLSHCADTGAPNDIRNIVLKTKDVPRAYQVKTVFMSDGRQEDQQNDQWINVSLY